ncbi:MAG: glycine/sarcosine/betaine reductase selenoprotein B family protein [Candidatus Binatia bacterium]
MADLAQLSFPTRAFLKAYRWRWIDPVPCTLFTKPLGACRVALVSTAGLVPPGAPPFDGAVRGGDYSYRLVPRDGDLAQLADCQRSHSYDHGGIARGRNLAFPLDRLREFAAEGVIGEVAPRHLSFMGSITAPGRLIRDTAPKAATLLVDDEVDVALLVPV